MSDINWKNLSDTPPETEGLYLVEIRHLDNIRYETLVFKKELLAKDSDSGKFSVPEKDLFCSKIYPHDRFLETYRDDNGRWFYKVPGQVVRYAFITE